MEEQIRHKWVTLMVSQLAKFLQTYLIYANILASLGRLQLDTEHFDSPLPSQRSTLRRDSHILAEISELETNLANQETVNTNITLFLPRSLKKRDNIIPTFFIFFSFIFLRFNVPDSYGCKVKLKMIFLVQHY